MLVKTEVEMTYVDDSQKHLDPAPEGALAGVVRLHKWQVHPVAVSSETIRGAAYLIKANYELEMDPGVLSMPWFEFGLHFDETASATVIDAVPQGARGSSSGASYALNRHMQLVEVPDEALVHVPAFEERVDLYGIGSASVRWRHSAEDKGGVRPGSRTAWLLLIVPVDQTKVSCRLAVRYVLQDGEDISYRPTQEPAEFTIALREPVRTVIPSPTAPVRPGEIDVPISVFFCYAHESAEFKREVRTLAQILQDAGLDIHLDQFDVGPRKNWGHWSLNHMMTCDITLAIASPMFRSVGDGVVTNKHFGLQSEMTKLETLYQRYPEWRERVLPVIMPGQSSAGIPLFLGPENEDYYLVDDYTSRGAEYLISAIMKTGRRRWNFE